MVDGQACMTMEKVLAYIDSKYFNLTSTYNNK